MRERQKLEAIPVSIRQTSDSFFSTHINGHPGCDHQAMICTFRPTVSYAAHARARRSKISARMHRSEPSACVLVSISFADCVSVRHRLPKDRWQVGTKAATSTTRGRLSPRGNTSWALSPLHQPRPDRGNFIFIARSCIWLRVARYS